MLNTPCERAFLTNRLKHRPSESRCPGPANRSCGSRVWLESRIRTPQTRMRGHGCPSMQIGGHRVQIRASFATHSAFRVAVPWPRITWVRVANVAQVSYSGTTNPIGVKHGLLNRCGTDVKPMSNMNSKIAVGSM